MYTAPFQTGIAGFNAIELRGMCEPQSRGDKGVVDLRSLGCPDHIFQKVIARRAKSLGLSPREGRSAEITDEMRREQSARNSALIAEDDERQARFTAYLNEMS
jgi:hypothetical protein